MRIHCLSTFLDGTDRFEKDDIRTVDDSRARGFIANGWAVAAGGSASPPVQTGDTFLSIHDSSTDLKDSNG
jgi:hypothetical protein